MTPESTDLVNHLESNGKFVPPMLQEAALDEEALKVEEQAESGGNTGSSRSENTA